MEAFKMILVAALCILITVIVSVFMRPEPCTHLDPGPDLVLLSDYVESQEAVISCLRTLKDKALTHTHPVSVIKHKHDDDWNAMIDYVSDAEKRQMEFTNNMVDLLERLINDRCDLISLQLKKVVYK